MTKFFRCKLCGKIVTEIEATAAKPVCCGEEMEELTANTVDAAKEKHVPVVIRDGDKVTVKVGSVLHPMEKEHYIAFIALETNSGLQIKKLTAGMEPVADFRVCGKEKVLAVYEYCNKHGLWKSTHQ